MTLRSSNGNTSVRLYRHGGNVYVDACSRGLFWRRAFTSDHKAALFVRDIHRTFRSQGINLHRRRIA